MNKIGFSPKSAIAEQELVNSLAWLIKLRWLAGIGALLVTWVAANSLQIGLPAFSLYVIGMGLLAYNALLWGGLRWLNAKGPPAIAVYQWLGRLQIGLDWLAMILLVHFSGGLESPALFYFLFHIPIASLLLPHDKGFLYVTLAPLLVGGLALLEYLGVLPHYCLFSSPPCGDLRYTVGVLFFFTTAAYMMAYISMTISRRLRRREDELTGLYNSVQATTSTLDLNEVLHRLVEATANTIACKGAAIRLLDESGRYLELVESCGLSEAYQDKAPIEVALAQIDQEALSGKTVLVADTRSETRLRYPEKVAAEGIRAILSTPLIGKRGPIGVLRAYCHTAYRFTQHDAAFLRAIAAQGAIAIENAQAYQLLEEMDKSKSQFVRIVTHELRSPAQVVISLLNVLEKGYVGELNEKQADLVARAQRRLAFLQTLISDLLDLAAGKSDVLLADRRQIVSLNEVIQALVARFEAPAQAKGLSLQATYPQQTLYVLANPADLDRMIGNLLSNAVKYTSAGEVRILLEQVGNTARVVVSDTGIGIPADAIPHLFEEFFRAENARALPESGTGLGLTIIKDLVERYNGRLSVESVEGKGTSFNVMLPLAQEKQNGEG